MLTYLSKNPVRCPEHTIQFLDYGYSQYIKKVLALVEINSDKIEKSFTDLESLRLGQKKICWMRP